jgi:polyisoprenoid-binding protein YceI
MKDQTLRKTIYTMLLVAFGFGSTAQTFLTRTGQISFYSKTPLEDIKAENHQANAAIDLSKKTIAIAILVKSFLFEKQLMQDHFNENYAESDKYPKANFAGNIAGLTATSPGTYPVQIEGSLSFHGVTRPLSTSAVLVIGADKLNGKANFSLVPSDFNIKIPALVRDKIANRINVEVLLDCPLIK